MSLTIGIDVGGTKIAAGVVDENGSIIAEIRCSTPARNVETTAHKIIEIVNQLKNEHKIEAVGIGAAGFCSSDRSTVLYAPNLAWRNEPLGQKVEEGSGLKVVVENDANVAAWGEFRFGIAREVSNVVVVTLGTGIGGGIIVNNQLLRGTKGFAGEIGHMEVKRNGRRCGCGKRGCWERYGSGTALTYEAKELASVAPLYAERLLQLAKGDPQKITGQMVTQAAQENDPAAIEIFGTIAEWIGIGCADLTAILDPEMIVLGGGVAQVGELLRSKVEKEFQKNLTASSHRSAAPIQLAKLGALAGIIGAADLARI